jgi:hypothetical integral membrane protein (TIGR02206 family)
MPLAARGFQSFTPQHFLLVGIFLVGAVVLVVLGRARRQRGETDPRPDRVFATIVVVSAGSGQLYQLTPGNFSLGSSLPLALCDLAWVAAAWALWTHADLPVALTYYWGLTLTSQGILTPSLGQTFPDPRYFMFWSKHFLVVWAAVYLAFGLGLGPGWRQYRATLAITLAWAVLTYGFDVAADVNYGYLVRTPSSSSLLDLFGPWPVYVVVSLGILLAGWALITGPWVVVRRRSAGP